MTLSIRNDPTKPSGGSALLEGPGLSGVSALSVENIYSGLFLAPDGRWAKQPHAFPVAASVDDSAALCLGPSIVDFIPGELQLALRTADGRDLGRLFWVDIVPSRSGRGEAPPLDPPPLAPRSAPPAEDAASPPPADAQGEAALPKSSGGLPLALKAGGATALALALIAAAVALLYHPLPTPAPNPTPAPPPPLPPIPASPPAPPRPATPPLSDLQRRAAAAVTDFFHRHDYRQGGGFGALVQLYPPQFRIRGALVSRADHLRSLGAWYGGYDSVQFQAVADSLDFSDCPRAEECLVRGTFKAQMLKDGNSQYDWREAPFAIRFNLATGLVLSECNVSEMSENQDSCPR